MTQSEARETAREYQANGIPAIADSLGGWSGGPRSLIWGVRLVTGEWLEIGETP